MTYTGIQGRVILFGGNVGENTLGDLWQYDTSTHQWTEIIVEGEKPDPRYYHQFTYLRDNKIILFGGRNFSIEAYMNDTWEYDSVKQEWTELFPIESPPGRNKHSMARINDSVIVMFGGETREEFYTDDTWEFDYDNNTWNEYKSKTKPRAMLLPGFCGVGNNTAILYKSTADEDDVWEYRRENE
jgi:N-acetylneuraminic acid mutarotase